MDWALNYYPAIVDVLTGQNPYLNQGLYCPPWSIWMLLPLWWDKAGWAYLTLTVLIGSWAALTISRYDVVATAAWMLSPFTIGMFGARNLEWMILAGLAFAPARELLLTSKLHLGGLALLFGPRKLPALLAIAITLLSLLTGPPRNTGTILAGEWNGARMWPWTIPFGLLIAWLYPNQVGMIAASCLLSPYIGAYSLALMALPLLQKRRLMLVYLVFTWAIFGIVA